MGQTVEVVASYGLTLDESTIKSGLRELNPHFMFDIIGNIGQWHPDIESSQGVFFDGKHVCTMDRGIVEEWPVWTMSKECLEIPEHEVRPGEISLYVPCATCKGNQTVRVVTPTSETFVRCRFCEGTGRSGICHVIRKIRDKCVKVGWQHAFRKIINHPVPGCTEETIERQFRVKLHRDEDLGARDVELEA